MVRRLRQARLEEERQVNAGPDQHDERIQRDLSSRRAWLRVGGVVDPRLNPPRLGDAKARDQGGDPGHVRRGHRCALLVAVERRSLEYSPRRKAVSRECAGPRREHTAKWVRRRILLQDAVAAGRRHLHGPDSVAGVEGLHSEVAIRGDTDHPRNLHRDDDAFVAHGADYGRRVIRACDVLGRMREVVGFVTCRRNHGNPLLHRELDRT